MVNKAKEAPIFFLWHRGVKKCQNVRMEKYPSWKVLELESVIIEKYQN